MKAKSKKPPVKPKRLTDAERLATFVQLQHSIECMCCGELDVCDAGTPLEAATEFKERGWSLVDREPFCFGCMNHQTTDQPGRQ